jgi:hypothetical protein
VKKCLILQQILFSEGEIRMTKDQVTVVELSATLTQEEIRLLREAIKKVQPSPIGKRPL